MTTQNTLPRILQPSQSFVMMYPEAQEFTDKQLSIFWLPDEIKLEKDVQDILVNMTEAERHGIITVLKLFTLYELFAGAEYWGGRIMQRFLRPELQRMAATFSMTELAIHQMFYDEINKLLGLSNDAFYTSYVDDPVLKSRMEFIDSIVSDEDELLSLGAFTFVEGSVLYSNFAYLKHFQSQGKNKLLNLVRGINFSVRDENLHALAGAWLFRTLRSEMEALGMDTSYVQAKIEEVARKVYEHECKIIDMIFEQGKIDGITDVQLRHFVESRINICLQELGYPKMFEVTYNPIADWFYSGINGFQFNDFFSGQGKEYHRNWSTSEFVW